MSEAMSTAAGAAVDRPSFRYRFDDVDFDAARAVLTRAGQAVDIEPRPLRLLAELLHHVNEVVTKEELFESVWDGRTTVDNVFANAVAKLRKALGETAAQRVVTVPKIGYRFEGPVERIATGTVAPTSLDFTEGKPVPGREGFVLDRPLGSANRGNVWLAHHQKIRTQLRVFKFAPDAEHLRQLKREYTLYRMLRAELGEREDFAQLLDSNFSEAPYFIECEYGGLDLLAWAAEPGAPLAALSQAQRLALFLQIAQAVAAAHSVGVLHKDLKPSNVLISGAPDRWVVKLTDFGSGRAMDPDRLRELGLTVLGMTQEAGPDSLGSTAMYLAPEVLAGRAPSTQSDVYSLGILLFQLLAGDLRRPMVVGWERDIADALLAQDIASATDGQPDARLGSVAELIGRLAKLDARHRAAERSARDEQLAAQAAALLQRSRVRRPWLIGALASLVLGLGASLWFQAESSHALTLAKSASERASAINGFLNEDVLAAANVLRMGSSKPTTMIDVLRQSSKRASTRFKGNPLLESSVRHQLSRVFIKLASANDGWNELEAAITLRTPVASKQDLELLTMRFEQVYLISYTEFDTPDHGYARARSALAAALQDAGPALLATRSELAFFALRAQTLVSGLFKETAQEIALAQRAVALANELPDLDETYRIEALSQLAQVYIRTGKLDLARGLFSGHGSGSVEADRAEAIATARAAQELKVAYSEAGRFEDALAVLIAARDKLAKVKEPSELHLGDIIADIAGLYGERGKCDQALPYFTEAFDLFRSGLGEDHQYTRVTASNIGLCYVEIGQNRQALRVLGENRAWFNAHATGGRYLPLELGMARAMLALGRDTEALAILEPLPPPDGKAYNETKWLIQGWKGVALIKLGRKAEGLRLLEPAVPRVVQVTHEWEYTPLKNWLAQNKAQPTTPKLAAAPARTG